ncbi:Coiled-coil domain-containing protein 63 [Orchesella cincta]|uniref:Coiled-coil domain-containing protein 63 n=1 Tax=Orchesella cincta TaxID=48709 RepID=A0A1D2NBV7_ORCCI|nr:Coiled-coil domain-containing protein 63 [Orchesella cincta]
MDNDDTDEAPYQGDGEADESDMPELAVDELGDVEGGETITDEAMGQRTSEQEELPPPPEGQTAEGGENAAPTEETAEQPAEPPPEEKAPTEGEQTDTAKQDKKKKKHHRDQAQSDDPEVDFETLVREEFKKLHRQYRLMEDARHAIAGASGKLSKQGRLLERLRDEKEDLLTDLKNARCRAYRMRDKQSINTILEALERYEKYKADITACLLSIAEMEANVDRITQRLVEQRLKVQALYGQSMTVPDAEHRKRILEDRLYHVTTQTDTLVTQNKELKVEINMMLKLRGSFYRRMLHIKKVSGKIKQRMGEVVYEATSAYDQRDDWVNKINILRERNDKDSKQHVLEIKEFQRVLHHDSKIHEFLAIKNKERELLENNSQRMDRKNRGKISELDQLLAAYKRSFKAILNMAKSRDIESLVNTYLEEEQKNYAVFKFITDLNHETNCLQEDIGRIKEEIEQLSEQSKETARMQEETLADFDKKLEEATKNLDDTLKEWTIADKQLEEFGHLLDEAFTLAGCSNAPIVALLGNQNGMGPHNICLCMKALEHRVTELLFEKGMLEVRKLVELDGNQIPKKPQLWTQGQKPPPQGGPFKPVVHVTGRVDSEQDDEDAELKAWSERPIYFAEMKDVIKQKMQAMQIADGKSETKVPETYPELQDEAFGKKDEPPPPPAAPPAAAAEEEEEDEGGEAEEE